MNRLCILNLNQDLMETQIKKLLFLTAISKEGFPHQLFVEHLKDLKRKVGLQRNIMVDCIDIQTYSSLHLPMTESLKSGSLWLYINSSKHFNSQIAEKGLKRGLTIKEVNSEWSYPQVDY